jgi:toxin-antitoxin system PIN domain toxin
VSYALDAGVLLYASDASSRYHERAWAFLRSCSADPDLLYLFWTVILGYLRIATHPSIFERPLSADEAMRKIERLLALPQVRAIGEQDGFWPEYRRVADLLVVSGNLVSDAHLAGLMRQHGVHTIWTHDRDFLKFDRKNVRDPDFPRFGPLKTVPAMCTHLREARSLQA